MTWMLPVPTPMQAIVSILVLLIALAPLASARELSFNRDIRPILAENCFYCHGQDANHRKADLRLDEEAGARAGGAVVPGDPEASALIARIRSHDSDDQMPPPDANRTLTEAQMAKLEQWIREGGTYETHWAFVTPQRPDIPSVENESWPQNPIDHFVLSLLEERGVTPSPEADRATLIKRLAIDLTGLPPSPDEVDAFVRDPDPMAYEHLVDRLMQSDHYGERMALPWLDAARYADSNGFQQDGDTWQWIWRDWVVQALNEDLPFDQFTTWQLAGDLLPDATVEQKIASGFNRNHLLNGEGGAIAEEQRVVIVFDRVDTTATTWLGLTMTCAQCHDHKYDPITMRDYYSLMDAFNRVPEKGTPGRQSTRIRVAKPYLELPTDENRKRIAEWEAKIATAPDKDTKEKWQAELDAYKGDQIPRPMIMSDAKPRKTHIFDRGAYLSPTEEVAFDTPGFLPELPEDAPRNRLGLARWLVSEGHPLTARVQANRFWQHFFGIGIVKTAEDFGVQSEYPIHGDLLDWLAVTFRDGGWSMKAINRLIVTSATYRQSSRLDAWHRAEDRENRLYARASRFRMPAMLLRDWALASAGLLDHRIGGMPVYPYQPKDVWEPLAITKERDFTYPASHGRDLYRRSLYTFWRRTVQPANMFDASTRQACRVRTSVNNTPLHALITLNDPTWVEAARHLAQRALLSEEDLTEQLTFACRHVLCRDPSPADIARLQHMHARQRKHYQADPQAAQDLLSVGESSGDPSLDPVEHAAFTAITLALYNLDEALTRQ